MRHLIKLFIYWKTYPESSTNIHYPCFMLCIMQFFHSLSSGSTEGHVISLLLEFYFGMSMSTNYLQFDHDKLHVHDDVQVNDEVQVNNELQVTRNDDFVRSSCVYSVMQKTSNIFGIWHNGQ